MSTQENKAVVKITGAIDIDMTQSVKFHDLHSLKRDVEELFPNNKCFTMHEVCDIPESGEVTFTGIPAVVWYNTTTRTLLWATLQHPELIQMHEWLQLSRKNKPHRWHGRDDECFYKHYSGVNQYTRWGIENAEITLYHSGAICERNEYRAHYELESFRRPHRLADLFEQGIFGYFFFM